MIIKQNNITISFEKETLRRIGWKIIMNIEEAKVNLKRDNLTCIIFNNSDIYTSKDRGVKPLLDLIDGKDVQKYNGGAAVDKVGGKASDCIKCGQCETACPQHLKITELLEEVKLVFE